LNRSGQWVSDVLISGGVGYASAGLSFDLWGGARAVAFRPESGEVVWSQTYNDEKHSGYGAGPCANMLVAGNTNKGAALAMGQRSARSRIRQDSSRRRQYPWGTAAARWTIFLPVA